VRCRSRKVALSSLDEIVATRTGDEVETGLIKPSTNGRVLPSTVKPKQRGEPGEGRGTGPVARLRLDSIKKRAAAMHDPYETLRTIQTLARGALESEKDEWLSADRLVEIQRRSLNSIATAAKKALAKAP
jgi:hypothetical protein